MTDHENPQSCLPNDSWFTEEQLVEQRAMNIHARFWQDVNVDDPHAKSPMWWIRVGARAYRSWKNEAYCCAVCDTLCETYDLIEPLTN